jgi:hypothetical protein
MVENVVYDESGSLYLCVDREWRVPGLRRNDLYNAVLASLWRDLAHVLHGIAELLLGRTIDWRWRNIEQPVLSWTLLSQAGLTSTLDGRHIQRLRSACTERNGMVIARRRTMQRSWSRRCDHLRGWQFGSGASDCRRTCHGGWRRMCGGHHWRRRWWCRCRPHVWRDDHGDDSRALWPRQRGRSAGNAWGGGVAHSISCWVRPTLQHETTDRLGSAAGGWAWRSSRCTVESTRYITPSVSCFPPPVGRIRAVCEG